MGPKWGCSRFVKNQGVELCWDLKLTSIIFLGNILYWDFGAKRGPAWSKNEFFRYYRISFDGKCFVESSVLDVWLGSEYTSVFPSKLHILI